MKLSEIKIGGLYTAKVSGKLVTVRVDAVRETTVYRAHQPHTPVTHYDVTSLATGRRMTFRSAQRFRSRVTRPEAGPASLPSQARPDQTTP